MIELKCLLLSLFVLEETVIAKRKKRSTWTVQPIPSSSVGYKVDLDTPLHQFVPLMSTKKYTGSELNEAESQENERDIIVEVGLSENEFFEDRKEDNAIQSSQKHSTISKTIFQVNDTARF